MQLDVECQFSVFAFQWSVWPLDHSITACRRVILWFATLRVEDAPARAHVIKNRHALNQSVLNATLINCIEASNFPEWALADWIRRHWKILNTQGFICNNQLLLLHFFHSFIKGISRQKSSRRLYGKIRWLSTKHNGACHYSFRTNVKSNPVPHPVSKLCDVEDQYLRWLVIL